LNSPGNNDASQTNPTRRHGVAFFVARETVPVMPKAPPLRDGLLAPVRIAEPYNGVLRLISIATQG
jgi:hypothetical protein